MRIIRRGTRPSERIWVGTCRNCFSTVECEHKELRSSHYDHKDAIQIGALDCPVCKMSMSLYPHPLRRDA